MSKDFHFPEQRTTLQDLRRQAQERERLHLALAEERRRLRARAERRRRARARRLKLQNVEAELERAETAAELGERVARSRASAAVVLGVMALLPERMRHWQRVRELRQDED